MTDRSIQVVMTENAWDGPTLLAAGTTQTLTASLAGSLVQDLKATYVDQADQTSNPGPLGRLINDLAAIGLVIEPGTTLFAGPTDPSANMGINDAWIDTSTPA